MDYTFKIRSIEPKSDLTDKLSTLGFTKYIQRMIINIEFLDESNKPTFFSSAIFDTGAPISLLPSSILQFIKHSESIPHTIHGIVNNDECQLDAVLTRVPIQIIDIHDNRMPVLEIPIAFVDNENIPNLIGMKGILDNNKITFAIQNNEFILRYSD